MNDEANRMDPGVTRLLDRRAEAAGSPLPWEAVLDRSAAQGRTGAPDGRRPNRSRWMLAAASLLLVAGAVGVLATMARSNEPAFSELPPPSLDAIDVSGVGPTRPLSSIALGDVVIPTRLFDDLVLEPVIVFDEWRSQWVAHAGVLEGSGVVIDVSTGMDGEQVGTPDVELTAGGAEWTVRSFGASRHAAFTRFDRLGVFVNVDGVGVEDLEVLLGGLRAGDPEAHAASTFDAESGGVEVTRSANGEYELDAAFVGEWLCSTIRPIMTSAFHASCVIPAQREDGSMVIRSLVTSSPADGESDEPNEPLRTTVFTAGIVANNAVGADIAHVDGSIEFARAEDRSDSFDVRFVLGVKDFDDPVGADAAGLREREDAVLRTVFDD